MDNRQAGLLPFIVLTLVTWVPNWGMASVVDCNALAGGRPAKELGFFETFKDKIKPEDDVVAILKKLPIEFRRQYVAAHTSLSTHHGETTPSRPRIVMYSEKHRALVAYSGDQFSAAGRVVEFIDLREGADEFGFHEIIAAAGVEKARPVENSGRCFVCHRGSPIWQSYPLWLSFFGPKESLPEYEVEQLKKTQRFAKQLQLSKNPRYQLLIGLEDKDALNFNDTVNPRAFPQSNARLTEVINRLQAKRAARVMERTLLKDRNALELFLITAAGNFTYAETPERDQYEAQVSEHTKLNHDLDIAFEQSYRKRIARALERAGHKPEEFLPEYDDQRQGAASGMISYIFQDLLKVDWERRFTINQLPTGEYSRDTDDGSVDMWFYVARDLVQRHPEIAAPYKITRTKSATKNLQNVVNAIQRARKIPESFHILDDTPDEAAVEFNQK